jgi:hemerythrin superfamily protein
MTTMTTLNIYEALEQDHRMFETLLDRLVDASEEDDDDWKEALDQLRYGVIAHAHAEEAVLYNALREADEGGGVVAHAFLEHAAAETELRALTALKAVDANWTSLAEKLRKDLRHHIEEEESKIFAAARKVFSDEEALKLGAAFQKLKKETAKDGDSFAASTLDLVANLLPPRLVDGFRKGLKSARDATAQR